MRHGTELEPEHEEKGTSRERKRGKRKEKKGREKRAPRSNFLPISIDSGQTQFVFPLKIGRHVPALHSFLVLHFLHFDFFYFFYSVLRSLLFCLC